MGAMTCFHAGATPASEAAAAAAAALVTATCFNTELEELAVGQDAPGAYQQTQSMRPWPAETSGRSTPRRPRAPVAEQLDVYCDGVATTDNSESNRHGQDRTRSRNTTCASPDRLRSPRFCTFATPLATTRLVLISPTKLGTRPPPKIGGNKRRRILQSIHSGNSSNIFKRGAMESFGDENVGFRPTKELRWSMQSTEPCYMDAHQPYREAAQAEAELMHEAASEINHGDWPV